MPLTRAGAGMHRPRSFAEAIAARYALLEHRWPTLSMAYQERDERGLSILNFSPERHSTMLLTPRLLLALSVTHREERPASVGRTELHRSIGGDQPSRTWAIPHTPVQVVQKQTEVVERIVSRRIREERPGRMADRPKLLRNSRVAQVMPEFTGSVLRSSSPDLVHRSTQRTGEEHSAVQEKATVDSHRPVSTAVRSTVPPVQSAAEIARITDHVLQALDRRIVSQRERMGRL